jgi:biopolymer transport protein ExbD
MYVALYADEAVPYREIVKVLNIANENKFKMVLATRPPESK